MDVCAHAAIEMICHGITVQYLSNTTITWTYQLLPMHYQNDIEKLKQKEFICKSCHKELKDGKYSKNVQNCPNSDMFGSNVNDD